MHYFELNHGDEVKALCEAVHNVVVDPLHGYCIVRNRSLSPDAFMHMVHSNIASSFTTSRYQGRTVVYDFVRDRGTAAERVEGTVLSATNFIFPLHTDTCYLPNPADVVVLYCIKNSVSGGESMLANINDIVRCLPAGYISFLLNRQYHINGMPYTVLEEVDGGYYIRFQQGDMFAGATPEEKVKMEEELNPLITVLADPTNFATAKLNADECLIMNNRTCLHGRYGFEHDSEREFLRSRNYLMPITIETN